jgi:catechol 2,3-dioxygenase-like lactoylglutathione lyase family enzyme
MPNIAQENWPMQVCGFSPFFRWVLRALVIGALALGGTVVRAQPTDVPNHAAGVSLASVGVRINVPDLKKALAFYVDVLNFERVAGRDDSSTAVLKAKNDRLIFLVEAKRVRPFASGEAHPMLTLQVANLDAARQKLIQHNVALADAGPRMEGVGVALTLRDPFGTLISMMQLTPSAARSIEEPRVYNTGLMIPSMADERELFAALGFAELSARFLPIDMPLGFPDRRFAFMLHYRDGLKASSARSPDDTPMVLVLATKNLDDLRVAWQRANVSSQAAGVLAHFASSLALRSSSGVVLQVVSAP